mmetsp:Transcript_7417/g.11912  ORF Transcript_7417/g.11912 Transcript_7417/m.11912 type:complete len:294 (-) Transcript_7417:3786-4667(-)
MGWEIGPEHPFACVEQHQVVSSGELQGGLTFLQLEQDGGKCVGVVGAQKLSGDPAALDTQRIRSIINAFKPHVIVVGCPKDLTRATGCEIRAAVLFALFGTKHWLVTWLEQITRSTSQASTCAFCDVVSIGKDLNIPVRAADRDLDITVLRTLGRLGLTEKCKLMYYIFKNEPVGKYIEEFPAVRQTLLQERSQYFTKLLGFAAERSARVLGFVFEENVKGIDWSGKDGIDLEVLSTSQATSVLTLPVPSTAKNVSRVIVLVATGLALVGVTGFCFLSYKNSETLQRRSAFNR